MVQDRDFTPSFREKEEREDRADGIAAGGTIIG